MTDAIAANCRSCGDEHLLGDRLADDDTPASTVCPVCGSTSYSSEPTSNGVVKSEAERISDAVESVYGVGEDTRQNIVDTFDVYAGLELATVDDLTEIDGVGAETANRITERLE